MVHPGPDLQTGLQFLLSTPPRPTRQHPRGAQGDSPESHLRHAFFAVDFADSRLRQRPEEQAGVEVGSNPEREQFAVVFRQVCAGGSGGVFG